MALFWSIAVPVVIGWLLYKAWVRYEHFQQFVQLGIPGPRPSVIIGNLWEIYKNGHLISQRKWHLRYGPVLGYYFGYEPILLVADLNLLKNILINDFADFSDRPELFNESRTTSLMNLTGYRWKGIRSTLTPSFSKSKLEPLLPEVLSMVDEFMDNVRDAFASGRHSVDINELYQALTLDCLSRSVMGADFAIQRDVDKSKIFTQMNAMLRRSFSAFSLVLLGQVQAPVPRDQALLGDRRYRSQSRIKPVSYPSVRAILSPITSIVQGITSFGDSPAKSLKRRCMESVKRRRDDPSRHRTDVLQLMLEARASEIEVNDPPDMTHLTAGEDTDPTQDTEQKHQTEDEVSVSSSSSCPFTGRSLSDGQVIDNAYAMLTIGYETTSTSLAFITRLLVRFPHVQRRLRSGLIEATDGGRRFELDKLERFHYLGAVIQECLRMYPPIYALVARRASKEKTYNGVKIPRGMNVLASVCEIHNNRDVFIDPHVFRPDRFLPEKCTADMAFAWLVFGAGPRNCIGLRFAQMLIKLVLARLLTRYRLTADTEPLGDAKFKTSVSPNRLDIKEPLHVQLFKL